MVPGSKRMVQQGFSQRLKFLWSIKHLPCHISVKSEHSPSKASFCSPFGKLCCLLMPKIRVEILMFRFWGCHMELFYPRPASQGPDCIALVHALNWNFSAGATTQWRHTLWRVGGSESLLWYCENPASTGRKVLEVCDSHSDRELKETPETSLLNFLHIYLFLQGEATIRRHWVTYLKAKRSPWESRGRAQDDSVESAKSCYPNIPINEVKDSRMLYRLS